MNAVPQRLEDTHPEVAEFMQSANRFNKERILSNSPIGQIVRISHGRFYRLNGQIFATAKEPGRNEKCPCESDKKYKRCCGR